MKNMVFLVIVADLHLGPQLHISGMITLGVSVKCICGSSPAGFSSTSIFSSIFSRLSARLMDFSRLKDLSLAITSS